VREILSSKCGRPHFDSRTTINPVFDFAFLVLDFPRGFTPPPDAHAPNPVAVTRTFGGVAPLLTYCTSLSLAIWYDSRHLCGWGYQMLPGTCPWY
jgi:hypothetical protein